MPDMKAPFKPYYSPLKHYFSSLKHYCSLCKHYCSPFKSYCFSGRYCLLVLCCWILNTTSSFAQAQPIKISQDNIPGSFALVLPDKVPTIITDPAETELIAITAKAFSEDLQLISGRKPDIVHELKSGTIPVIIGTLGQSKLIDQLALNKLIPSAQVKGKWETFCITVINDPKSPREKALVIFGSDPRGTAFGVFEFSKMLGVSPWVWWADVRPKPQTHIYILPGKNIVGPPSVKYRGFFVNDEDWGMRPWAAKNMDKDLKDIGPRTYEKIFELMLRLKANYLWPAMHPGTKAFWYYKENPELARKYGILMGSSHHEPMLRDTEFEWNENFKEEYGKEHGDWRYDTNKDEIYRFFDDRVRESVNNQAIYTVGMRATKDGAMPGPTDNPGKIKILESVIHDQREILQNRLKKPANLIPQVFCPYKEVLELYRAGLKVPDDVTITWVDDNHGYIRQLPNPVEQKRSGGNGVYYHFSYWGQPQDYLWLASTSPVLTSFEMSKAYALHARNIWVFNVGDIKPAELELEFGLDLAWNVNAWTPAKAHGYMEYWAGNTFGKEFAKSIGKIKSDYYRLAAAAKPEHLTGASFTPEEIRSRLKDYRDLVAQTLKVGKLIPDRLQDAYFELISYPVEAACSMNEKILYAQESLRLAKNGQSQALEYAEQARAAYAHIGELGQKYNLQIANGKWAGMMDDHPRGRDIFNMPKVATADSVKATANKKQPVPSISISASSYTSKGNDSNKLQKILGLGLGGSGLTVWPLLMRTFTEKDILEAPYADYKLVLAKGKHTIQVKCLPGFPLYQGLKLRFAISINGAKPEFADIATLAETKPWSANVLKGYAPWETKYHSDQKGEVSVRIYFPDPGLVINQISVQPALLPDTQMN